MKPKNIQREKKRTERKNRISLMVIVAALIFLSLIILIALSAVLVYVLFKLGVIAGIGEISITSEGIISLSILSLALGAILSAIISALSLQPVNMVMSQMNRLASGDFKARLTLPRVLENYPALQELTDGFNKMAAELESTEMLRADFINNFSHEFKTPIVSITGFAKLLKRGNLTEEQKKEYIEIIEKESMRLSRMATNVLNLTKYENQTILTDVSCFNLSEQIRSCILALEGKWDKKNIEFNIDFDEHMISANKEMLYHVWINLLDNAIKFTHENGIVNVFIKEKNDIYEVAIENMGEALTKEQQKRIFNKFYQADESHSSEGNGIGLALVKRAVDLHSGEVFVESKDGKIIFTVRLRRY